MVTAADDITITFLGLTDGAEVLGATQADFAVDPPNGHTKELSVLLNSPAAALLAERFGQEDTEEFRERAAAVAGEAWIRRCIARRRPLDSVTILSRAILEREPEFVASLAL